MPDRERLPRPAEDHRLVRHEPGQPHRVDRHSPLMRAAVAFAVPDGASSFVSWCSSTISAAIEHADASSAKRIMSTAPSAKFGAKKHGTPASRAIRSTSVEVETRGPDHDGDARSEARLDVGTTASGRVKSTATSHPPGRARVRRRPRARLRSSAGASTAPTLPAAPKRQTFMLRERAAG